MAVPGQGSGIHNDGETLDVNLQAVIHEITEVKTEIDSVKVALEGGVAYLGLKDPEKLHEALRYLRQKELLLREKELRLMPLAPRGEHSRLARHHKGLAPARLFPWLRRARTRGFISHDVPCPVSILSRSEASLILVGHDTMLREYSRHISHNRIDCGTRQQHASRCCTSSSGLLSVLFVQTGWLSSVYHPSTE